jgi:hypothetical protein
MIQKSFTKAQAEKITSILEPVENILKFHYPDMGEFIITIITPAPFPDADFDIFKEKFNFTTGPKELLDSYKGDTYRVIAISERTVEQGFTGRHPYFFDVQDLTNQGIAGFSVPDGSIKN